MSKAFSHDFIREKNRFSVLGDQDTPVHLGDGWCLQGGEMVHTVIRGQGKILREIGVHFFASGRG